MKTHLLLPALLAGFALPLAAQATHEAAKGGAPHWTYEGAEGPAKWGSLDASYKACGTGKEQSPIDLGGAIVAHRGIIDERFYPTTYTFFHNGHTVQAALDRGSTLVVDGAPFQALQFHFHHPSEHTVKGKQYPAEIHLVHRNAEGNLAVLGIFVSIADADNPQLEQMLAKLPKAAGDSVKNAGPLAVQALLGVTDKNEDYYLYRGSLTTPPCTEGVQWIVRQRPITASTKQLQALIKVLGENARPVQAVNDRH